MKVLVTGTSGFLGREIIDHLKEDQRLQLFEIRGRSDFHLIEKVMEENSIDVVIHAGFSVDFSEAPKDRKIDSENIRNTRKLCELVKLFRIPHFIFLSAAGVMGVRNRPEQSNEDHLGHVSHEFSEYLNTTYIQDKIKVERDLKEVNSTVTILYLSTVYGPRMPTPSKRALQKILGFRPIILSPPGGTSYLDLRDFLEALEMVIFQRKAGRFILSSGNLTYKTLFQTVATLSPCRFPRLVIPLPRIMIGVLSLLQRMKIFHSMGMAIIKSSFGYKYYSPERARIALSWKPRRELKDTLHFSLFGH